MRKALVSGVMLAGAAYAAVQGGTAHAEVMPECAPVYDQVTEQVTPADLISVIDDFKTKFGTEVHVQVLDENTVRNSNDNVLYDKESETQSYLIDRARQCAWDESNLLVIGVVGTKGFFATVREGRVDEKIPEFFFNKTIPSLTEYIKDPNTPIKSDVAQTLRELENAHSDDSVKNVLVWGFVIACAGVAAYGLTIPANPPKRHQSRYRDGNNF